MRTYVNINTRLCQRHFSCNPLVPQVALNLSAPAVPLPLLRHGLSKLPTHAISSFILLQTTGQHICCVALTRLVTLPHLVPAGHYAAVTGHLALAVQHFEAAMQGPPSEARLAAISAALTLCAGDEPDALSRAVDLLQEQGLYEVVKADLPHGDRWADTVLHCLLSDWLCWRAGAGHAFCISLASLWRSLAGASVQGLLGFF